MDFFISMMPVFVFLVILVGGLYIVSSVITIYIEVKKIHAQKEKEYAEKRAKEIKERDEWNQRHSLK